MTDHNLWDQAKAVAPQAASLGIVTAGAVIASAISYQHEYELARHNGQAAWVSALLPFSVDGMIFVAGVALAWAAANGIRGWGRLWQPRLVLVVGVAATIAANMFSDLRFWWLGPAVAASSGVALILMSAVAFWLLGEQRRLVRGGQGEADAGHVCPPPPVSLAEVLPAARVELKARGEACGEQELADRFGTTRHRVRVVLSPPQAATVEPPPAVPSLNGGGHHV